ncbi:MAG: hypothetical protein ACPG4K_11935 [Haloferula sp.]
MIFASVGVPVAVGTPELTEGEAVDGGTGAGLAAGAVGDDELDDDGPDEYETIGDGVVVDGVTDTTINPMATYISGQSVPTARRPA